MNWNCLVDTLAEERNCDVDSFIENTEAGKELYEICYELHEENSLYFDLPPKGDYLGNVKIYLIICNEIDFKHIIQDIEVRKYSKKLVDIALESLKIEDFRKKYSTYCRELVVKTIHVDV